MATPTIVWQDVRGLSLDCKVRWCFACQAVPLVSRLRGILSFRCPCRGNPVDVVDQLPDVREVVVLIVACHVCKSGSPHISGRGRFHSCLIAFECSYCSGSWYSCLYVWNFGFVLQRILWYLSVGPSFCAFLVFVFCLGTWPLHFVFSSLARVLAQATCYLPVHLDY